MNIFRRTFVLGLATLFAALSLSAAAQSRDPVGIFGHERQRGIEGLPR